MKTKTAIITVLILVLAIAFGVFVFVRWSNKGSSDTQPSNDQSSVIDHYVSEEPATNDQQAGGQSIKDTVLDEQPTSTGDDYASSITVTNQSSGILYIRTKIEAVTSSGSCTLKMNGPSNKTYSATSQVQALTSYSTCQGFNVPISNLTPGIWNISISYSEGSHSATMQKDINIQ